MSPIEMPVLTEEQQAAWHALFELSERIPTGWTLVGGQMVHLHCAERGFQPYRSTPDADAVVDARRVPMIFTTVTQALEDAGFKVGGETDGGKQLRWVRGKASIDVLIPQNVGRAARVPSSSGKPGLETPGAQHALDRSELIDVSVVGRIGRISRPTLIGAVVMKSAAWSVPLDRAKKRHLDDICLLASMLGRRDLADANLSKGEKRYLRAGIAGARNHDRLDEIPGARDGLDRLTRIVDP